MSLSIGIVGLPNVGKSTLFNALLKRQAALAANYPFATIEPNVGIVDVPDYRLEKLSEYIRNDYGVKIGDRNLPEKVTPTVVKFYDIAGLVKGASQGEGLGNEFLGHIREVDAIIQVVRDFHDENVIRAGAIDPKSDIETINTELILADLQSLEKKYQKIGSNRTIKSKEDIQKEDLILKIKDVLNQGNFANTLNLDDDQLISLKDLNLLTLKPIIYILNVDENLYSSKEVDIENELIICAKIEEELSNFSDEEKNAYMKELGISESGLDKIIKKGHEILGLDTFLTMGPKEVRAWTMKRGCKAPQAAGVIHTDFERGFISADVINFDVIKDIQSLKKAKELGKIRLEGKEYTMKDGDIVEFKFSV